MTNKTKNISKIKTIILDVACSFGNCIAILNRMIFGCEIIGCHFIILNKNIFWFITKKIRIKKYNITIIVDEKNNFHKYNNSLTLFYNTWEYFSFFYRKLMKSFPNIKYSSNSIREDISLLMNAYNIVNSISSFLNSIIQLNYNLQYLWEYNIYHIDEKMKHLNHELFHYPNQNVTIFKMEPSSCYINKMYHWKNKRSQIILMLKEKCINEFTIFKNTNF